MNGKLPKASAISLLLESAVVMFLTVEGDISKTTSRQKSLVDHRREEGEVRSASDSTANHHLHLPRPSPSTSTPSCLSPVWRTPILGEHQHLYEAVASFRNFTQLAGDLDPKCMQAYDDAPLNAVNPIQAKLKSPRIPEDWDNDDEEEETDSHEIWEIPYVTLL